MTFLLWISVIVSGFINNVPYAATIAPIIAPLSEETGLRIKPLIFSVTLGATFGGNLTLFGASSNLIIASVQNKHTTVESEKLTFKNFFRIGVIATLISCVIANLYLLVVWEGIFAKGATATVT